MIKLKDILNERQQLNEKKELSTNAVQVVQKFTDRNNHTEARLHLCTLMGNKKLAKFYNAMMELRDVLGGYGPELSKLNQKMEKELYKSIKKYYLNSAEVIGLL